MNDFNTAHAFDDTSSAFIDVIDKDVSFKESNTLESQHELPTTYDEILADGVSIGSTTFVALYKGKPTFQRIVSTTKRDSLISKFEQQIFRRLHFPKHWTKEGIAKPNVVSKESALAVCTKLYAEYDLVPDRIAPTKEEGVYLCYELAGELCDRSLIIEIYNSLDVTAIVNDNHAKEVIYCEDIRDMDFGKAIRVYVE